MFARLKTVLDLVTEWFANVFYTFGVAFITWALLAVGTWAIYNYPKGNEIQIYPLGFYTAMWVIAILFPFTSTLYLVFDLRLRRNQIQDAAERGQIQFVYFPHSVNALHDFVRLLRTRFRETCQPLELVAFSTVAGLIAFIGTYLVFYNAFAEDAKIINRWGMIDPSRVVIFAAFSGSLAGALIYIFNKFRTFDIYPSTYLQAIIGFISGSAGAVFIGSIYEWRVFEVLAFAVGFLTAVNVTFLSGLLRRQVAHYTGIELPPDVTGDLNGLIQNAGAIESLHNISIYSVAELVKADPLTIYLSLPAPIGVINGWLDEGLILYYFGPENAAALAHVGVRRFTQLVELAVADWPPPAQGIDRIIWKDRISLFSDLGVEVVLREEVRCIIEARLHHNLLGILSDRYRRSGFPVDGANYPR